MTDNTTKKIKVGKALRNIRKERTNYTVEQASSKVGKSKVWLSQIETGKKNIYFDDARKLCQVYGIKISELSDEVDKL